MCEKLIKKRVGVTKEDRETTRFIGVKKEVIFGGQEIMRKVKDFK